MVAKKKSQGMLHAVIIWQSGFNNLSKMLLELQKEFKVKYCQKIVWEEGKVHKNLTQVYPNRDFTKKSPKVKEIGGNNLFLYAEWRKSGLGRYFKSSSFRVRPIK